MNNKKIIYITEGQLKHLINENEDNNNNNNDNPKIKPTIEWIQNNYDKANEELFNGKLGKCNFDVKNVGVHTLGQFSLRGVEGRKIQAYRRNRIMYSISNYDNTDIIYLDIKENFEKYGNPTIILSSIYAATEDALYATLVHEMCHYYTYMNGYAPKQGHGIEFKYIGEIVSYKSHGKITIQRLASAEQMKNMQLDDIIQQQLNKRNQNKANRANFYMVLQFTHEIPTHARLINTHNEDVVADIINCANKSSMNVIHITNKNITSQLFNQYNEEMRTYKYWDITSKQQLIMNVLKDNSNFQILNDYNISHILKHYYNDNNNDINHNNETKHHEQLIPIFKINFKNGNSFILQNTTYQEIINKLKEKYPKWTNDNIMKTINTDSYFPQGKGTQHIDKNKLIVENNIQENNINEINNNNNNDTIEITPDMNLGVINLY